MNLCKTPNQHAQKPSFKKQGDKIIVQGYNAYEIINRQLINQRQNNKFDMLKEPYLDNLENLVVSDLGCANGVYSIHSALKNAKEVNAVDIDKTHLDIIQKVKNELSLDNLNIVDQNIDSYTKKSDIVIALAIIHWIYSCTTVKFGSLDKIMEWFASITDMFLIIEWVDAANDKNVNHFKHLKYNTDKIMQEYSKENFDKALAKYFNRVKFVGDVNKYRKLYVAYK
jgi:23S rRNA U2552 (ribose-2'-O)-methylase RlmE/FtsJ